VVACGFQTYPMLRAVYGKEEAHQLLHLLSAIEIAKYRINYDINHQQYTDLTNDHETYMQLLCSACELNTWSDILHILVLSPSSLQVFTKQQCQVIVNATFEYIRQSGRHL